MARTEKTPLTKELRALFRKRNMLMPEFAMIQDATPFLELLGPELAHRLLMVSSDDDRQYCLRPEFTIPACQHYVANRQQGEIVAYGYCDPVFRARNGAPCQFIQAGVEFIGESNRLKANRDCLALAIETVALSGAEIKQIRFGDMALFSMLIAALDLPLLYVRRLKAAFGNPALMAAVLRNGLAGSVEKGKHDALQFEHLLKTDKLQPIGRRSLEDITSRLAAQKQACENHDINKFKIIDELLKLECRLHQASAMMTGFFEKHNIPAGETLSEFCKQCEMITDLMYNSQKYDIVFDASFGQKLGYYNSFAFEIMIEGDGEDVRLISGGRYDALFARLGTKGEIPATGFAIWLDALPKMRKEEI